METFLAVAGTVLSVIAIVVGVGGILRAEHLFKRLDANLTDLISNFKRDALRETTSVTASFAAFAHALQFVELKKLELQKDAAFALFTQFHLQRLLHPDMSDEDFARLRKTDRDNVDKGARDYIEMLVKSGMATVKPGFRLEDLIK